MKFNEKLIKLRKASGLSQEELADKLNVARQTVSKWELGETTPEMNKLIELSDLFDVSIDEMVKEAKMPEIIEREIDHEKIDGVYKDKMVLYNCRKHFYYNNIINIIFFNKSYFRELITNYNLVIRSEYSNITNSFKD